MKKVINIEGKGRGVVATEPIKKDTLIELSHVIEIDLVDIEDTLLDYYAFEFGKDHCICLGIGSLFNHNSKPNVRFDKLVDERQIAFYTMRDIEIGDELTIDYGWGNIEKYGLI